jgi:hypothetical protein
MQEILLGATLQAVHHEHHSAAVARILTAAEVSERDEAFVRTIAGPEEKEWWHGEDPRDYPWYSDILNVVAKRVDEVCTISSAWK